MREIPFDPAARGAARIVEAVQEAVALARLPAGTRLREGELAKVFATSRANVREALKSLAERGLVVIIPNRGAAVPSPTLDEARQCYAARALLEGAMVAELAQIVTAADIRRLREHIVLQRQSLDSGERRLHLKLMGDFHRLLAEIYGNAELTFALDRMITRTSLMTALFPPESQGCAVDDHVALIDALTRGDGAAARTISTGHLHSNHARLRPHAATATVDLATVFAAGVEHVSSQPATRASRRRFAPHS